jgi:hypothetical protein
VFIELKAVYKNIRTGFENNLKDYLDEHVIGRSGAIAAGQGKSQPDLCADR